VKITRLVLALAALAALVPAAATAAPIRTLVYHFSYDARNFGSAPAAGGGTVNENSGFGTSARAGKLTVEIMAATGDGGLVVDVTENVDRADRPMQKIRCAIYGKTVDAICDQGVGATDEQQTLLEYLGRFFYDPTLLDDKGHWHTTTMIKGATVVDDDFTVEKTDGSLLTIKIDRKAVGNGVKESRSGTMLYNADLVVPMTIHQEMASQDSGDQGDQNVDLKLLSDSMATTTP
jgi:hypothetical protein